MHDRSRKKIHHGGGQSSSKVTPIISPSWQRRTEPPSVRLLEKGKKPGPNTDGISLSPTKHGSALGREAMGPVVRHVLKGLAITTIIIGLLFGGHLLLAGTAEPPTMREVIVQRGDTLWALARSYGPERTDVRVTVDRIRRANNLDGAFIRPGMKIFIPVE